MITRTKSALLGLFGLLQPFFGGICRKALSKKAPTEKAPIKKALSYKAHREKAPYIKRHSYIFT